MAEQVSGQLFGWVSRNPEAASLIGVGLASPGTRGFTVDVGKIVAKETIKSTVNITKGIGTSLVSRSNFLSNLVRGSSRALAQAGQYVTRTNPILIPAALAVAGSVTQHRMTTEHGTGIRGSPGSVAPSYHMEGPIAQSLENNEGPIQHMWWDIFKMKLA